MLARGGWAIAELARGTWEADNLTGPGMADGAVGAAQCCSSPLVVLVVPANQALQCLNSAFEDGVRAAVLSVRVGSWGLGCSGLFGKLCLDELLHHGWEVV